MTATTTATWTMPDLDTVYKIEDGPDMTLRQMLDGIDPELLPADQTMFEDLLWAFGAWESLEKMQAALASRQPARDFDGKTGFRLVK